MDTYTVRLVSLTCHSQSDFSSSDEIWMQLQSDAGSTVRVPLEVDSAISLKPGETWNFEDNNGGPLDAKFTIDLQVALWDQDFKVLIGATDYVGSADYTSSTSFDGNGMNDRDLTNGASSYYTLTIQKVGAWPDVE